MNLAYFYIYYVNVFLLVQFVRKVKMLYINALDWWPTWPTNLKRESLILQMDVENDANAFNLPFTVLFSLHTRTDLSRKNEVCFMAQRENRKRHYFPRSLAILIVVAVLLMLCLLHRRQK